MCIRWCGSALSILSLLAAVVFANTGCTDIRPSKQSVQAAIDSRIKVGDDYSLVVAYVREAGIRYVGYEPKDFEKSGGVPRSISYNIGSAAGGEGMIEHVLLVRFYFDDLGKLQRYTITVGYKGP